MKGFPVVSAVILVAGLAAAIYISAVKLMPMREEMYSAVPERMEYVFFPMFGIDKFYADVQWVGLMQEMGDPEVRMGRDEEGKKVAMWYYEQFDRLTDLSPDTEKFYHFGAMQIAFLLPDKAIELLQKGNRLCSRQTWERSYTCAQFVSNFKARRAENEAARREFDQEAVRYLEEAMDYGGYPVRVETAWLHKQARLRGLGNDKLSILQLWHEHYKQKLLDTLAEEQEAREEMAGTLPDDDDGAPDGDFEEELPPDEEAAMEAEEELYDREMSLSEVEMELRDRIMRKAQKLAMDYWRDGDKEAKENMETVRAIFFDIAPPDRHFSPISLRPYHAGDFYDTHTGTRVRPFGISFAAWDRHKLIVELRGRYCHVTGQSREASMEAWEAWWAEHRDEK